MYAVAGVPGNHCRKPVKLSSMCSIPTRRHPCPVTSIVKLNVQWSRCTGYSGGFWNAVTCSILGFIVLQQINTSHGSLPKQTWARLWTWSRLPCHVHQISCPQELDTAGRWLVRD